jgi:hypothetical protein
MSINPQETERRASVSSLCDILAQIAAALRADQSCVAPGVEVITEDQGDIDTEIVRAVGALGLVITVMFSGARGCKPNLPGPVFGTAAYVVEVAENAVMNRSAGGGTALEIASACAVCLHQYKLRDGRMLLVTDLIKAPDLPKPATNGYHIPLTLSNVSILRKAE